MKQLIIGLLVGLSFIPNAWAAPDNTLSITPPAVAGTTITAADENDRNSDVSTAFNAHDHNDIDQLSNSTNLGDGTAGNKSLCANAADATDSCLRWNDTANLWTIDHPVASSYNTILVATSTVGLTNNALLIGTGTGGVVDDSSIILHTTVPSSFGDYSSRVFNNAAIAITSGTATTLTMNSERWDTDTMHDTGANTGRITATTAGKYFFACHAEFAAGNPAGFRRLDLRLNGATTIASQEMSPAEESAAAVRLTVSTHYNLAATNYVECLANQTGQGSLNVNASGNYSPEFEAVKVP